MTTATLQDSSFPAVEQAGKSQSLFSMIVAALFMVKLRESQSDESCAYAAYLA